MKKIWILLLMVSVVAGMTLPAMAKADASAVSTSNGGANTLDINNDQTASNYAAHSVSVTLNAAPQTNNIHDVLTASGDNTNGAIATFAGTAKAGAATSGAAASGGSGTGAAVSGTATSGSTGASDTEKAKVYTDSGDAKSKAETGDSTTGSATTGDASTKAEVKNNDNTAKANDNMLMSGNADSDVKQINIQKQITPVVINNDQQVIQKIKIKDLNQDASSNPVTAAKAKSNDKKTNINLGAGDDIEIGLLPFI